MQQTIQVDLSPHGRLEATERDRLDLINRLSTNKVVDLQPGEGCATVFTTAVGRIIDQVVVLNTGEKVWLITGNERRDRIYQWLQRNVFFNDEFQIRSIQDETGQIGVCGPESTAILEQLWPGVATLKRYHFLEITDGYPEGKPLRIIRFSDSESAGYWLIAAPEVLTEASERLSAAGIDSGIMEDYHTWRISAGLPDTERELTEEYIPLELGLWDAVSFNKGCYIGQEIIARMESRGKLARIMVHVKLTEPVPAGTPLVNESGKSAGTLTSVAETPEGIIGLAVVKATYASDDQELQTQTENPVTVLVQKPSGIYETTH